MKAWVLHGPDDLRFEEREIIPPAPGWVRVKVCAAGICGSDVPRIFYTGAHRHPLIPGHEFAGEVVAAADEKGSAIMGKRVGVFPLIPCGVCAPCRNKLFEMCRNYDYLGSRCDGGFAEYVNVPAKNLIILPGGISYEEAAMLEPLSVAIHAARRCLSEIGQEKDKTIVICGLGTIGLLLLGLLKGEGYEKVYAIGNKDFQRERAASLGLPTSNYYSSLEGNASEWIYEITGGRGTDIFFECVGREETIRLAVLSASPGGRVVFVGNPASDIGFPKEIYWKILRNQLRSFGTWNSSFTGEENDDWHFAIKALLEKKVDAKSIISHSLSPDELMKGLLIMRDKTEDYGKICIKNH